ncbi:hypothetical protein BSKO_14155 [Bryopsis sp. KO-2023]|nr:hypothetical protein BSKO_14155 [Bryopsis sp. KO-2023]
MEEVSEMDEQAEAVTLGEIDSSIRGKGGLRAPGVVGGRLNRWVKPVTQDLVEQHGGASKGRLDLGCQGALLVDSAISGDAQRNRKTLRSAMVDLAKAFDSVSHEGLVRLIQRMRIPMLLKDIIERLVSSWVTKFELRVGKERSTSRSITLKRGIFQGDTLSPLLFCLAMAPTTVMLRKEDQWEWGLARERLPVYAFNHQMFIDDLKMYGKSEQHLGQLIVVARRSCEEMGLQFSIEKCAKSAVIRGKQPTGMSTGVVFAMLSPGDTYKYLGIPQGHVNSPTEFKRKLKSEYYKRVHLVWSSGLSAKNKVVAHNSWAVGVFKYAFGVLAWTKTELEIVDRRTRHILQSWDCHKRLGNMDRLYMSRDKGGRGLVALYEEYMLRVIHIACKICLIQTPILRVVGAHDRIPQNPQLRERYRRKRVILGRAEEMGQDAGIQIGFSPQGGMEANGEVINEVKKIAALLRDIKRSLQERRVSCLLDKHDMGKYMRTLKERSLDIMQSPNTIKTPALCEYDGYQLWWDFKWTAVTASATKPDMVIVDKRGSKLTIVEATCCSEYHMTDRYREKEEKYRHLAGDLRKIYGGYEVAIVPVVIGVLGGIGEGRVQVETFLLDLVTQVLPGERIMFVKVERLGNTTSLRAELENEAQKVKLLRAKGRLRELQKDKEGRQPSWSQWLSKRQRDPLSDSRSLKDALDRLPDPPKTRFRDGYILEAEFLGRWSLVTERVVIEMLHVQSGESVENIPRDARWRDELQMANGGIDEIGGRMAGLRVERPKPAGPIEEPRMERLKAWEWLMDITGRHTLRSRASETVQELGIFHEGQGAHKESPGMIADHNSPNLVQKVPPHFWKRKPYMKNKYGDMPFTEVVRKGLIGSNIALACRNPTIFSMIWSTFQEIKDIEGEFRNRPRFRKFSSNKVISEATSDAKGTLRFCLDNLKLSLWEIKCFAYALAHTLARSGGIFKIFSLAKVPDPEEYACQSVIVWAPRHMYRDLLTCVDCRGDLTSKGIYRNVRLVVGVSKRTCFSPSV